MTSVTGQKSLATYLELDSFDVEGLERYLYMGCKVVTPFSRVIRKSTWFGTSIRKFCPTGSFCKGYCFNLTPSKAAAMDFLLYTWLRWKTPQVNLVNLPTRTPVLMNGVALFSAVVGSEIVLPAGYLIPAGSTIVAPASTLTDPIFSQSIVESSVRQLFSQVPEQRVKWSNNLFNNFVDCLQFVINGQPTEEQDRIWLDFVKEYRLKEGQVAGYDKMIGNVSALMTETYSKMYEPGTLEPTPAFIESVEIKLPLPFSFSKNWYAETSESGNASTSLPLLNLYCNDVEVCVRPINDLKKLLVFERQATFVRDTLFDDTTSISTVFSITSNDGDLVSEEIPVAELGIVNTVPGKFNIQSRAPVSCDTGICVGINYPQFINVTSFCPENVEAPILYAKTATVTEDERKRHRSSCILKSLLMERVVAVTKENVCPGSVIDVPLNVIGGQTRALFFVAANQTGRLLGLWSNYTNNSSQPLVGVDSIKAAAIIYKDTDIKVAMPSDHFSEIEPFYHAQRTTTKTGYHLYSWAFALNSLDPDGSVGLHEIENAKLRIETEDSDLERVQDNDFVPSVCNCIPTVTLGSKNTFQYAIEVRALGWQVFNILNDNIAFC